jgi:Fic family protein
MFNPPHHDHVPVLIDDLVAFARRTDIPLLTQAAVAHAQFETIHPFPDGNGRTGRALIHSMLRGHGLTHNVTVPVSAGLLTDTSAYFDALTAYREGEPSSSDWPRPRSPRRRTDGNWWRRFARSAQAGTT